MVGMRTRRLAPHRSPRPTGGKAESSLPRLLADLSVVIGTITGLLYYFGWVKAQNEAWRLGFDVSALDLSTPDCLMKSLNVLFVPVLLLLLVALGLQRIHRRIAAPFIAAGRRTTVLLAARLLCLAWLPLAVVAVLLMYTPLKGYALPLCLVTALLLARYGRMISQSRTGVDPWPAGTRILVGALLALATFWTTERVARTVGQALGAEIAAQPSQLTGVVLYSAKDLRLDAPGVVATPEPSPRTAYGFRYSGLYLLERSGNRYFLITDHPGRVIIVNESADVRIEFVGTRGSDVKP